MNDQVICFGEVLWDILPAGSMPGGAPMNVAIHLSQLGINTGIISRVGKDEPGKDIVALIRERGVNTDLIQFDDVNPTGTVHADTSNPEEVKYKINEPAAWDHIEFGDHFKRVVSDARIFVYGSLAVRNANSLKTLTRLLELPAYKVFDVNLRKPFYSEKIISSLLLKADMVKMNEEELIETGQWFFSSKSTESLISSFSKKFNIDKICVTRGSNGAIIFEENDFYYQDGFSVKVADTIGSGDSFLATLIAKQIEGKPPSEQLRYACAVGALVASKEGATPYVNESEIKKILSK